MMTIEQYMALPYTMIVRWHEDDGVYVARIQEIDGCTGHGDTPEDAICMLKDNLREWIAFSVERGEDVPVPANTLPSGKWVQRVPRSLHKRLAECAEADGVSLNAYVTACLARSVGRADEKEYPAKPGELGAVHAGATLILGHYIQKRELYGTVSIDPYQVCTHDPFHKAGIYLAGPDDAKTLCRFMDSVAGQVGSHSVTSIGRNQRESEEEVYKEHAYA